MKIAITGHSAGIGQALSQCYESRGHEIVGLSRRNGHNIRNIPKIAEWIEPCDMWINNAQAGFAQTELLFEIAQRWLGSKKSIIVISTMMTQAAMSPLSGLDMDLYRIQKLALEESVRQLRSRQVGIKIMIVRPGNIATSPDKTVPPAADVDLWAESLISIIDSTEPDLMISDISLGPVPR
jgi:nucleoside-diphosphate-sugar epimerase